MTTSASRRSPGLLPRQEAMSGFDKQPILAYSSTQSWPTATEEEERCQHTFLLQSKKQSTTFDVKEGLVLGQSSLRYLEEESSTDNHNHNRNNNIAAKVQYPNLTAAPKTDYIALVSQDEGTITEALNPPPNYLRPNENSTKSFYARIVGPIPPPSSAILQLRNSEKNYAKRLRQLGCNSLPGNSPRSFQSISKAIMSSESVANFSGPMFRQLKVEYAKQHERYRPYSLHSAGADLSPYPNQLNETPAPPPPPPPRSLSFPEFLQLAVGRLFREPGNHTQNCLHQKPLEYSDTVPPVTVVVEGRSICQRIFLEEHSCYESFAQALRGMFVGSILAFDGQEAYLLNTNDHCNLSNAIPGYLIAYEDKEGDLLLAGDLSWNEAKWIEKFRSSTSRSTWATTAQLVTTAS